MKVNGNDDRDAVILDVENKEILEILPVAIYLCDKDGVIVYFNQSAVELWGTRPNIGVDKWSGSEKLFHPDGSPMTLESLPVARVLKTSTAVHNVDVLLEQPDGKRFTVLQSTKPIFDGDDQLSGALTTLVDVGNVNGQAIRQYQVESSQDSVFQAEKDLAGRKLFHNRDALYHKMIEEITDYAITLLDIDGTILSCNKGAKNIKGYSENEILGKHFKIFYPEEDRQANLPERLIGEAKLTGRATHEGWRLRKDGTVFWGNVVITALHDDDDEIIGFSKVTRDLTDKKIADDQLKDYARKIEFKNSQLEEYAYIASHDLKEPLRKIQTFTELLSMNLDDKETIEKNVDKIRASANRMTTLVNEVLNYSQLTQSDELFVPVDLNEIVKNIKGDFELLIQEKNVAINHDSLPVVLGVSIQIHQLFSNIIGNAIKFADKNPVIEIAGEKVSGEELKNNPNLDPERNYLKLSFKDNGIGIESQYADQIFKMFQRLHNKQSGTGIGLALCKRIAENHHGDITVRSEIGKGSTFEVFLPF